MILQRLVISAASAECSGMRVPHMAAGGADAAGGAGSGMLFNLRQAKHGMQ